MSSDPTQSEHKAQSGLDAAQDPSAPQPEEQAGEEQAGEQQAGEEQAGEEQAGEEQAGEDAGAEVTAAEAGQPTEEPAEVGRTEQAAAPVQQTAGDPAGEGESEGDEDDDWLQDEEDTREDVEPLELDLEEEQAEELQYNWYILKVQVNREESIRAALQRRVKVHGLEEYFRDIIVPTEDVAEFNKSGQRRVVKKKLYPGYIMVQMAITDDTWFLVRETPGIGDFTGSAGTPTPMDEREVEKIIKSGEEQEEGVAEPKAAIPFDSGDRVRVKDGNFQNFEGEVESVDETHGRVTVMINIFGRPTPVELEHWQIESL